MNYPQGSEWRKWDLHVHTPASIYHKYPGTEQEAWEAFLSDLEGLPPEFKVIGINDYLFLDGYKRVLAERAKGRLANIDLVLPVIELRLDKFVGHDSHFQRVNFHVIFDTIDPEVIETQFINLLSRGFKLLPDHEALSSRWSAVPTRKSLKDFGQLIIDAAPPEKKAQYGHPLHEGFNNFNVILDNLEKALKSTYFQGRYVTAVGKTEWDAIKWTDASIAEKRNVINNAGIVFTASETVATFHKAYGALIQANVNSRLLDCSDAHTLSNSSEKNRIGNCFTWIKGDTTFAAFLHAIKEYNKRVFIGDVPDKMTKVRSNPTKYIQRVQIKKVQGSSLTEPWFDVTLPVNDDLVAIIGNKGSGKSALADSLGLLGNTKQSKYFSFLNPQKFCDPRDNKASHFEATLTWKSGISTTKRLDSDPDLNSIETIKYLPQNYIETLCNEIAAGGDDGFNRELKQIIFSHVNHSERLGYDTLDDVLSYITSETEATKRVLIEKLHGINEKIVQLEERASASFRAQLESQLRIKREELEAHNRSKPNVVPEPTQSNDLKRAAGEIRQLILTKKEELNKVESTISTLIKNKTDFVRRITLLDKITTKLDNFNLQWQELKQSLTIDLQTLNVKPQIAFDDVVQLTINRVKVTELRKEIEIQVEQIDEQFDLAKEGSAATTKASLQTILTQLQDSLDEPNRKFVAYQNELELWEKKRVSIQGDLQTHQSISWLEQQIAVLEHIPTDLLTLQNQRTEVSREIYREIKKLADSYRKLYHPVQEFIEKQTVSPEAIPLSFQVAIVDEGFAGTFLEKISRQVKGTFSGLEESNTLLRGILGAVQFDKEDSVLNFLEEINTSLHFDKRSTISGQSPVQVADQIRKGESPLSVYDYIYSLSYLSPRYTLHYNGHEINQLSPGERGLLLLVFYLLIDKDEIPLIIDQPEENLDNQTIYEVLVRCLGDAKVRRQIIVVTHNPNLAVVCDAEQVIHAHRDSVLNSITYNTGGIENPVINKQIIDVLEGTRPAFKNRDSKYFVKD